MDEAIIFLNSLFPKFQNEFRQRITVEEASLGIKDVIFNAEDLLMDSLILFKANKYPRSIALAIMAVEEISKIEIIKKILLAKGKVGSVWKEFKRHKAKNHIWYYPVLKKFDLSIRDIVEFQGEKSSWVERIDELKNNSLYVNANCTEGNILKWNSPANLFDKDFCGIF